LLRSEQVAAEQQFQRAIKLNERYAAAHYLYGVQLMCLTRFSEAERELKRAEQIEPTSVGVKAMLGVRLLGLREYGEAKTQLLQALELEPDSAHAEFWLGCAFELLGQFEEACPHFERFELRTGGNPTIVAKKYDALRLAVRDSGEPSYWRERVKGLGESCWAAAAYGRLGETEHALDVLERALREQRGEVFWLNFPFYDALRDAPRFQAILEKTGMKGQTHERAQPNQFPSVAR
jgi:hypothetical protein